MDTSQGEDHANEVDRAMRSTIEIISRSIEMINVCSLQEKKILTLLIRAKDVYAPKRQRRRQREMENEDGERRRRVVAEGGEEEPREEEPRVEEPRQDEPREEPRVE